MYPSVGRKMSDDNGDRRKYHTLSSTDGRFQEPEDGKLWSIFIFGLIGAMVTTFAMIRPLSTGKGANANSFRSRFQEGARKSYGRRMKEEYEEELERVERIRRMQSVFNRERNKSKRSYESWSENDQGAYHQQFQRDDWYWKPDKFHKNWKSNCTDTPRDSVSYSLSHHYSVLGLDRLRTAKYTDDEIKTAFRAKVKQYHPDQNQENKEAAEAKFKEVMTSFEAIKKERKNSNC